MTNILVIKDNNYFLVKNNIEYTQARFIKVNKIAKTLLTIMFTNLDLISILKYLSYKNVDE